MDKMTDSRAAEVLAAHNEWRRGGDGQATDPTTLGLALDHAIARLREPADAQAQGGGEAAFKERVADMLPRGTTISDPEVVAERLMRAYEASFTEPPSAPVGVEGLIAKWRSEAAQLESVGDDNALAKAYAQRLDADELEGALGQQSEAVAPTTAECPHDWEQDEAHEDWARCYKCGISRRKPLAQQPAAVDAYKVFHAVSAYVSPADRSHFRKALEQALAAQPGGGK